MPIYEYLCTVCGRKSSFLVKSHTSTFEPRCSHCDSTELRRLLSTFAYHRSLSRIHEESGEPERPGPDYYKDPRNIGRWVEKKFKDMGMELPSQLKQKIEAAREGVLPDSLKDLQSASPDAAYH